MNTSPWKKIGIIGCIAAPLLATSIILRYSSIESDLLTLSIFLLNVLLAILLITFFVMLSITSKQQLPQRKLASIGLAVFASLFCLLFLANDAVYAALSTISLSGGSSDIPQELRGYILLPFLLSVLLTGLLFFTNSFLVIAFLFALFIFACLLFVTRIFSSSQLLPRWYSWITWIAAAINAALLPTIFIAPNFLNKGASHFYAPDSEGIVKIAIISFACWLGILGLAFLTKQPGNNAGLSAPEPKQYF